MNQKSLFLALLALSFLVVLPTGKGEAQGGVGATVDTGAALTPDMKVLDQRLIEQTRYVLERWGTTFHAFALYIPDTSKSAQMVEVGPEHYVDSRLPSVHRDSLRAALRTSQARESDARVIGIITDSIAGPIEEAIDGADGPDLPRMAITELEDRSGRCRRIERQYLFAKEPKGDWGFGTVIYGPPRVTRCDPLGYWPANPASPIPVVASRPHLAAPIVRPLDISSLSVIFTVVGDMHGKLVAFDDSIVITFDSLLATRRLPNDARRVRLDSIRVGVGVGDNDSWTPVDDSKALIIGKLLPSGGKIVRHDLRFVLPHERRDEDSNAWIVVTFHITVGRRGHADYQRNATTYAHSEKGLLAEKAR